MQPKLLKTTVAKYVPAEYHGENESGCIPIGDRVLVLPDVAAEELESGIIIPGATVERHSMASEGGVVVALGDSAFRWNSDRTRPFEGYKLQPGDRVVFERYAGQLLLGDDGKHYRIMEDTSIGGLLEKAKSN